MGIPTEAPAEEAPALITGDATSEQEVRALPEAVVQRRTATAAFGLSDIGKQYEDIYRTLSSGQELSLRQEASAELTRKRKLDLQSVIYSVSQAKKGPLNTAELDYISQLVNESNKWDNPYSVLEAAFSEKFLNNVYATTPVSSWFSKDRLENPEAQRKMIDVGETYATKYQILSNIKDEAEAIRQEQSWPGYLTDRAKGILSFGLYGEVKERANVPGSGYLSSGFLLGTNINRQRAELWRQNIPEFEKTARELIMGLAKDNPALAVEFADKLMGRTDIDIENLFSGLTIFTAPGVIGGTKLVGKAALALTRRQAQTAIEDMVKGTTSTETPKVAAATAAGNLEEAAVTKATTATIAAKDPANNPIKQAVDSFPKLLKEQGQAVAANPGKGPGSQELTNRILAAYDELGAKAANILDNILRVTRIGGLADEATIRLLKDRVKELYAGVDSRVVDVDGPFHSNAANVKYWELQIGKHDGTLFGSPETAAAAARIEGITLKGEANSVRQQQLQKLIAKTEYELNYTRMAQDPSEESRALLGLTEKNRTPKFEANLKKLESDLLKYQTELEDLRKLPGATIEQQGTRFYISKYEPLLETDKTTRSLLMSAPGSQPYSSWWRSLQNVIGFNWLRTPEETEARDAMSAARIAMYGPNRLLALAKAELAPVHKLARFTFPGTNKKQAWENFETALKEGRSSGKLFDSPGELQDFYLRHFNREASALETEAYFAWRRYGELKGVLEDLKLYKEELRQGGQNVLIRTTGPDGKTTIASNWFKAVERRELPNGEGILMKVDGVDKIYTSLSLGKRKDAIAQAIKEGKLRAFELLYPNDYPLQGFTKGIGKSRVQFVITDSPETAPLSFTRVERRGNGLWDLDYPWYIKQARLVPDAASATIRYIGDRTLMPMINGAMGKNIVKIMEASRAKILEGDEAAAEALAKRLPIEWSEFRGWFNPTKGIDGKEVPALLDKNHEIRLVPGNKMIVNMDDRLKEGIGTKFRDDTVGNLIQKNYLKEGERDAYEMWTIRDEGSRHSPLYKYEPAQYIDPIPSMNRAMKALINSTFMDDYKTYIVEHWVQRAKGYLNATPAQLADAPYYHFYKAEFKPGTPLDIKSQLLDSRYKAQGIWGQPGPIQTTLHGISQYMADAAYEGLGPKGKLIPSWMIASSTDGAGVLRSMAYHAAIGLWSVPQFMVQQMTYVTIAGIEGVGRAGTGALGALLHALAGANASPEVLKAYDKFATRIAMPSVSNLGFVRFKPGEWLEAREGMLKTAFNVMSTNTSVMNDPLSASVVTSGKQAVLDAGTIFFRKGELSARYGAWYTAYKRFREEHPVGKISDTQWTEIFDRAEMLSGNMSAASKSLLQKGPLEFTTQFLGYSLRLMEQFTGKRLTVPEKIRLFTTYLGTFGVSAFGLAGFPAGDLIRKAAIDNGYTGDTANLQTWIMEGVPSMLIQLATGKRLAFGQRYGSPGFDFIRSSLEGDKGSWELWSGASGSVLSQAWEQGSGFRRAMMSIVRDDDKFFPLKTTDLLSPLKTVSSFNAADRWINALHTGNWLSKKGQVLDTDIGPLNATLMTLTGLQPQRVADIQPYRALEHDQEQRMQRTEQAFLKEIRNFAQSVADRNYSQAQDYGTRARAILKQEGYPVTKIGSLMARAERENQSLVARTEFNFYLRDVSPDDARAKRDAYQRKMQQEITK